MDRLSRYRVRNDGQESVGRHRDEGRSRRYLNEICCAILGHVQVGLRRLNSTTAAMISRLGPLGPDFPRFFGENSNLYFCFCRKSRDRKSVAGRRATAACLSLRLERKEAKKPSRIRCSGLILGARSRPRLRMMSCCVSRRFWAMTAVRPSLRQSMTRREETAQAKTAKGSCRIVYGGGAIAATGHA